MSKLLEILGRGMTVDTAELIWDWLNAAVFCENQSESSQTHQLHKVIELIAARKVEAAEEQLRLHLFDKPACTHGRLAAAAIALHENQLNKAIEELNSVYMRQPNNTLALYGLGHCYERLGEESQAVEFYQDCLKFKNYLQLPRQRLAAIYFKNRQVEKTITEYELLKSEYPDDMSMLVTLGHLYIAAAMYTEAIQTFNTAILIHPDNFTAEDDLIDQLIRDGQLEDALEQIEDLLESQPERAELMMKRADILGMLGATSEAICHYQEAIRLRPEFLEATIKLGTQYVQSNQELLAAQQFNRAVEINDRIVDAYIGLATAEKLAGNIPCALATLSLAAAIQPNSSLLLAETATLQLQADFGANLLSNVAEEPDNLIEAVIDAHQKQIAERPQNPDLHHRLGVLLMSVGRMAQAITAFHRALEINPTYSRARSKLAVCLFETNRKDHALEQLTGHECLDKDTLELHYKTALLYSDSIKFASSLIDLEHLLENNFACADTTVSISVVLQNLGLLDRVTAMWDNLCDTASRAQGTNQF
ncbi:MAG: tetratricopeptide repeat protein [Planctomycetota bacterium]|nr:MAG: tetratricopeptide repeat protein [Planctomycetota bacterium]